MPEPQTETIVSGELVGFFGSNDETPAYFTNNFAPIPFKENGSIDFDVVYALYADGVYWTNDIMKGIGSNTLNLDANPIPVNPDTVMSWIIGGDVNAIVKGAYPDINVNDLVHKNGDEYVVTFLYLSPWEMVEEVEPVDSCVCKKCEVCGGCVDDDCCDCEDCFACDCEVEVVFASAEVTSFTSNLQGGGNNKLQFTVTITMSDGSTYNVSKDEAVNGGQSGNRTFDYGDYKVYVAWNDNNKVTTCKVR